jgi:hypothetical protein
MKENSKGDYQSSENNSGKNLHELDKEYARIMKN